MVVVLISESATVTSIFPLVGWAITYSCLSRAFTSKCLDIPANKNTPLTKPITHNPENIYPK